MRPQLMERKRHKLLAELILSSTLKSSLKILKLVRRQDPANTTAAEIFSVAVGNEAKS